MEARFVMIHHIQFSNFFLFINHMPVKAAADVNASANGTVLSVRFFNTKKRTAQHAIKKITLFLQSFPSDFVMTRTLLPSFFLAHIIQPTTLITV